MAKKSSPLFAFWGTPRFATVVLGALEHHGLLPALVITAPDKKRGRGLQVAPAPAKAWAQARGIDVLTPENLKDPQFAAELQNSEWELFVVAAYNKLLPPEVLDIPKKGSLNVHPSLLPKFRGPSPALSAILANERATGVSIMQMTHKMDAGPIVAQARVELEENAWPPKGSMFEDLLAQEGGNLLAEVMAPYIAGAIEPEEQDERNVTYTKKFTDGDALVDLQGNPETELLKIRAFDRNPRAHFFTKEGTRVIITEADIQEGALRIGRVIPEGKKETSYEEYLRGRAY